MKKVLVYIENRPSFYLQIGKNTLIKDIKNSLIKYKNISFHINNERKLDVFDTDKYDKVSLKDVWNSIDKNSRIYVSIDRKIGGSVKEAFPTYNKDIDRMILLNMSDGDILNACSINKYLNEKVCTNDFFERLLKQKYPDIIPSFFPVKWKRINIRSFHVSNKHLYVVAVYYISKLKEIFEYDYVSGNPRYQLNLLQKYDEINSLFLNAVSANIIPLAKYALNRGASINNPIAIRIVGGGQYHDFREMAKFLIENGVNLNLILQRAKEKGNTDMVEYLENLKEELKNK